MILDDLERQNGGFIDFWQFWAATHISRVNCAEITTDRAVQPAYEIFYIKCRFKWSMSWRRRFTPCVNCQFLVSTSLDFVCSGPSNMHCYCTFLLALAGLSCHICCLHIIVSLSFIWQYFLCFAYLVTNANICYLFLVHIFYTENFYFLWLNERSMWICVVCVTSGICCLFLWQYCCGQTVVYCWLIGSVFNVIMNFNLLFAKHRKSVVF